MTFPGEKYISDESAKEHRKSSVMLPNDDSIEIIDPNNNDGESLKKPDEEKDHNDSIEILSDYQVVDGQNVKEIKLLLYREGVAEKIYTLEVPFLFNDLDILSTIFSTSQIFQDELDYRIVDKDYVEKVVKVNQVNEPNSTYQYIVKIETPTVKLKPLKFSYDDCQIAEDTQHVLSMESSSTDVQCLTPKSVDSQETYFEEEMKEISLENELFFSCLDEENDISVKKEDTFFPCSDNAMEIDAEKNEKNCDALFAILNEDEHSQEIHNKEDDKETVRDSQNATNSHEIDTSKFYLSSTPKNEQRFTSQSQKTVQLSDSPILSRQKLPRSSKSPRDSILAVYPPPPTRGGIPIYKENYKCLGESEYLNDVIIDFYLKYLSLEVLKEDDRNRTHIFSSQFFTRLSKPPVADNDTKVVIPESERRHNGVERWTKNINIFEKDFVIIPINEHFHWNLAIICYPGLVGVMNNDIESTIRPCILFFDSLMNKSKDRIATILRGYLAQEYLAKMGEEKSFSKSALQIIYPKVPKQSNATDCGLYVLQYVEQFFKNPIMDFTEPLNLSQWFKCSVINQKRAQIASLVAELAKNYNPDKVVSLPHLQFPSACVSSDEEDLYVPTKRKNPLYKEKYASFTTDSNTNNKVESCSSAVLKKKKSNQRSLDGWIDRVRDASSSSDEHNLSMDLKTPECQFDMNDYLIDSKEDDVVMEELNDSAGSQDKSLCIISDIQSPEKSSLLSKSVHRSYMDKKIGLITEEFSGPNSHIIQRSIFSDKFGEQSSSGARPKRDCRTKGRSELLMKLAVKHQERKRKNELKMGRCESEEYKNSNKWIDTSDFNSSKPFSFYNVDEEKGISPSTSYSEYKTKKKYSEQLLSSLKN